MGETETGEKPEEAPPAVGFFDPRLNEVRRKVLVKWARTGMQAQASCFF
jgi:hypothetical protein